MTSQSNFTSIASISNFDELKESIAAQSIPNMTIVITIVPLPLNGRSAPAGLDRLSGSRGVDSSLREWTVDDALRGGCALLDRSDQESRCSTDNAIRKSYDQDRGQAGSDLLSRQTEGNLSRTPCDEPDSRTDSQLSMAHYSTAVAKDERDAGRRHGSGARSRNDPLGVIRPQSAGPRLYTGQPRARLEGTSWSAQSEDRRRTRKGRDGKYADDVDAPQSVLDKATKRLATRGRGTGSKEDGATNIRPSGAEQDFLPEGWTKAVDEQSGHIYYYSDTRWVSGLTPIAPAENHLPHAHESRSLVQMTYALANKILTHDTSQNNRQPLWSSPHATYLVLLPW